MSMREREREEGGFVVSVRPVEVAAVGGVERNWCWETSACI